MSHMSAEILESAMERESRWMTEREKIDQLDELTPEILAPAFEGEPGSCTCVDEGTGGDIRLAGSGILHPGGIEAVARILRQAGTKEVTSHDGCGAAKEAYRRAHGLPEGADIGGQAVNDFAKNWSKALSVKAGASFRHITTEEMDRPADWHDASSIYLDFTGRFQPHRVPNLPKGFVISGSLLRPDDLLSEIRLTAGIALGKKGYGDRFTAEQPLAVVIVGETDHSYEEAIQKIQIDFGDRLAIHSVAVPEMAVAEAIA